MPDPLRLSAKTIAELALPNFCPRCFWRKLHVSKLPFQIFPGIFSSIDSYTKRFVHAWFDEHASTPPWLSDLGDLVGYSKESMHHTKFRIVDNATNITLTGTPDDIFQRADGSHLIVDYKTAKYTGAQDKLFPLYEAQLNGYAFISADRGPQPVTGLALIYMEPVTDDAAAHANENRRDTGFAMGFAANVHPVRLDLGIIPPLLRRVREIFDLPSSPPDRSDCPDCQLLDELIAIAE